MSKKRPGLKDTNNNPGLINLGTIPNQAPVASFNLAGIENLINTKGFVCYHYRYAFNPQSETLAGPVDPNTQGAFRGLRYYDPRPLYHIPQGFKMDDALTAQAIYGQGSVMFNLSGEYYDKEFRPQAEGNPLDKVVHVRARDLLIFPSLTDVTEQKFEYNPTGTNKLHYKCRGVDILFDGERDYVCDQDFDINDHGEIRWLDGGRKPDFKNGKGAICSVVYYYTPIYIVWGRLHHLRVIPTNSVGHAAQPRDAMYAPQQIVCKPSTIIEEKNLLDWTELPPLPEYPDSKNVTGGSS